MDSALLRFLFGEAIDPDAHDLDDIETRARLLEDSFEGDLSVERLFAREIVANQIYADEPAEVWVTAQRLLASGLDRARVFSQLSMAFASAVRTSAEDGPFDRDAYARALLRLPAPEGTDLERVLIEMVRSQPGIDVEELEDAALAQLGCEPGDEVAEEMLDHVMDHLVDDLGPLAWLAGDRTVHVGDLTAAIVLTHCLTEKERATATLDAVFDLAGFTRWEDLCVPGGDPVDVVSDDRGQLEWVGPPGWLEPFGAGDLLAVRVSEAGVVDLVSVEYVPVDSALVERLRAVYDAEVAEPWLPVDAEDLVLGLQFDDRGTFAALQAPLRELCLAAGLEVRGNEVAHDETVWFAQQKVGRVWRVMDAEPDSARSRTVLRILDLADLAAGVDPAAVGAHSGKPDEAGLRSALSEMSDARVLSGVASELFDSPEPHAAERAERFVEALVGFAAAPGEASVARFLAAVAAERAGDPVAGEAHIEAGLSADPDSALLTDRLAWYASDGGDAARALHLWRTLKATPAIASDVREVERALAATGARGGRNQPCWCGSGRKYKHCHLGAAELEPLPERVGWLCRKAVAFMERRGGSAQPDAIAVATARAVDPDDPESVSAAFDDPIVMDLTLTEGGWFERFLTERGALLPADEALLAESWVLVDRTVYEVLDVRVGDGLDVRDLRTGDRLTVRERTFSRQTRRGALFCGRAVPDGQSHQFVGGLFPVDPGREVGVLELLDRGDPEEIADHVAGLYRPPGLQTREGEVMIECDVVIDVADWHDVRSFLDAAYEADEDEPDRWVEMHPLDDEERVLRAQLGLDAHRLSVTTTSEERAERVLGVLRGAFAGLRVISDRRRPIEPAGLAELARRLGPPGGGAAVPFGATDASGGLSAEVMEELADRFERRWCDESVPALAGLTPREAAADPTRRDELIRLIDSFEAHVLPPGAFSFRPDRLRQLLGLTGG